MTSNHTTPPPYQNRGHLVCLGYALRLARELKSDVIRHYPAATALHNQLDRYCDLIRELQAELHKAPTTGP